jgi:hypothetical protein
MLPAAALSAEGALHKKHCRIRDYASCVGVIRRGGSAQRASASGGHFLFFVSLSEASFSGLFKIKNPACAG